MFGQNTGQLFGGQQGGGAGGGLFNQPQQQQGGGGLFNQGQQQQQGGLFGNQNRQGQTMFGGQQQQQQQQQPQQNAGMGLFGGQQNNQGGGGMFGTQQNQGGGQGLFGGANTNPTPSGNIFGGASNQQNAGLFNTTPNMGAGAGVGGGMFGQQNQQQQQQQQGGAGGNLFGMNNQGMNAGGGGLFGGGATNTNTLGGGGGGGGGQGGLFGTQQNTLGGNTGTGGAAAGGGLFGMSNNNQQQQGGMFGQQQQQQQTQGNMMGGGMFGGSNTNNNNQSLFGGQQGGGQQGGQMQVPYNRVQNFQPVQNSNPQLQTKQGMSTVINCISVHQNHIKSFNLAEIRMLDYRDIKAGRLNVNQVNQGGQFGQQQGMFGGGGATAGGAFGQNNNNNQQGGNTMFGGGQQQNTGGGLFNTTPQGQTQGGGIFGGGGGGAGTGVGNSQTPLGGGIFGGNNQQQTAGGAGGGLFGNPTSALGQNTFGDNKLGGGGLLGGGGQAQNAGGGLFGGGATNTNQTQGGIFGGGGATQQTGGGLFSNQQQGQSTLGGGLFGTNQQGVMGGQQQIGQQQAGAGAISQGASGNAQVSPELLMQMMAMMQTMSQNQQQNGLGNNNRAGYANSKYNLLDDNDDDFNQGNLENQSRFGQQSNRFKRKQQEFDTEFNISSLSSIDPYKGVDKFSSKPYGSYNTPLNELSSFPKASQKYENSLQQNRFAQNKYAGNQGLYGAGSQFGGSLGKSSTLTFSKIKNNNREQFNVYQKQRALQLEGMQKSQNYFNHRKIAKEDNYESGYSRASERQQLLRENMQNFSKNLEEKTKERFMRIQKEEKTATQGGLILNIEVNYPLKKKYRYCLERAELSCSFQYILEKFRLEVLSKDTDIQKVLGDNIDIDEELENIFDKPLLLINEQNKRPIMIKQQEKVKDHQDTLRKEAILSVISKQISYQNESNSEEEEEYQMRLQKTNNPFSSSRNGQKMSKHFEQNDSENYQEYDQGDEEDQQQQYYEQQVEEDEDEDQEEVNNLKQQNFGVNFGGFTLKNPKKLESLDNITDLTIENEFGSIQWTEPINLKPDFDFEKYVEIEQDTVTVTHSILNGPAKILFKNFAKQVSNYPTVDLTDSYFSDLDSAKHQFLLDNQMEEIEENNEVFNPKKGKWDLYVTIKYFFDDNDEEEEEEEEEE